MKTNKNKHSSLNVRLNEVEKRQINDVRKHFSKPISRLIKNYINYLHTNLNKHRE